MQRSYVSDLTMMLKKPSDVASYQSGWTRTRNCKSLLEIGGNPHNHELGRIWPPPGEIEFGN